LVVLNATPAQIFNALHDEMIKDSQYRFHLLLVSALYDNNIIKIGHNNSKYLRHFQPGTNPQVDIFFGFEKCDDGFYRYKVANKKDRGKVFQTYYWEYNDIYPLKECQFGPLKLPCPNNPESVFDRYYGKDWQSVAYTDNHTINNKRNKKITLTDELKKPALPTHR